MATRSRSEPLPQRELVPAIRDLVDDLQASVAVGEWSRTARRLRQLLETNREAVASAYVQHNIGERRVYLQRFAVAQGVEL